MAANDQAIDPDEVLMSFSEERVTLIIGQDMQQWSVGRQILERSALFRTMLREQWLKKRPRTLELPEADMTVLRAYLHFLSTDCLPALEHDLLADLYLYGMHISDLRFQRASLDSMRALVQQTTILPQPEVFDAIYDNTTVGSFVRRLIVDIFHHFGEPEFLNEGYSDEFWADLATRHLEEHKHDRTLIRRIVAHRLEMNEDARLSRSRKRWNPIWMDDHSDGDEITDAVEDDSEEDYSDLAMACGALQNNCFAKRGRSQDDDLSDVTARPAKQLRRDDRRLPQEYRHHNIRPGRQFATGA